MCDHGTYSSVILCKPRQVSGRGTASVDACIADEVQLLNEHGIITTGSCCGHGDGNPTAIIEEQSYGDAVKLGYSPVYDENTGYYIITLLRAGVLS